MDAVEFARAVASYAHSGQKDKAGKPYIMYPAVVSEAVVSDEEKIVALLHDVLEDTFVSEATIRNLFGDTVADAVVTMTKKRGENYADYIRRVSNNPISKAVKLADLEHNMDLSRLNEIQEADLERIKKYEDAKKILLGI